MSNKNTMTITRKIALIPEDGCVKKYRNRVNQYLSERYPEKIQNLEQMIKKEKDKDIKADYQKKLEKVQQEYAKFEEGEVEQFTQKMINDYTYDFVRKAMASEADRKNTILSEMRYKMVRDKVQKMTDENEIKKWVNENIKDCYRIENSSKGSIFDDLDIENPLGGYGVAFSKELTEKIKKMVIKDKLLEGKISLPCYKQKSPFTLSKKHIQLEHGYENADELEKHIADKDCLVYLNVGADDKKTVGVVKPTILRFRLNLGHKKNRDELLSTILKIFHGEYSIGGSKIQIEKHDKDKHDKIMLNLSIKIPISDAELKEDVVVGVDLGMAVPAVCAVNNDMYDKKYIGNCNDFLRVRNSLQSQRKRAQKSVKLARGGSGRKRKLKALEQYSEKEKRFVDSYCHKVSKEVVDYALKHNAKYINIEDLSGFNTDNFVLRNWSFYKLQQYIKYKAEKEGMIVRKVNPAFTSQVCSFCGHWEEGQRVDQKTFVCKNPDCTSHNLKFVNADYNAARNIALTTLFTNDKKKQKTSGKIKEAAKKYGIPINELVNDDSDAENMSSWYENLQEC